MRILKKLHLFTHLPTQAIKTINGLCINTPLFKLNKNKKIYIEEQTTVIYL